MQMFQSSSTYDEEMSATFEQITLVCTVINRSTLVNARDYFKEVNDDLIEEHHCHPSLN